MKALYAGTFNLFHAGHYHVYKQACQMFGSNNVYLCAALNKNKASNLDFIKWTLNPITPNVIINRGLITDEKPDVLIRGLRDTMDLSAEMTMADWNTKLGCQTIFIPCTGELRHLSSSSLRYLHASGKIDLVKSNIPKEIELSYDRWCQGNVPFQSLFCGKIGIGKSTYLKTKHSNVIDCDKAIWQFFTEDEKHAIKKKFTRYINNQDYFLYNALLRDLNPRINWSILFSKTADYEVSSLGAWFKYIPNHILARFNVIELVLDESIRKRRLEKRGLNKKTVASFDSFYKSPAFIDKVISI